MANIENSNVKIGVAINAIILAIGLTAQFFFFRSEHQQAISEIKSAIGIMNEKLEYTAITASFASNKANENEKDIIKINAILQPEQITIPKRR